MTVTNASELPIDTGPTDTGPTDTGPSDTGPPDSGPTDTGPASGDQAKLPSLWRNRTLNLLWSSQLLSDLGSNMSSLAFPLLVLALTGSPITAGIVGTAASITRLALRLPAGVLADRINRKRAMIACDAVRLVAFAALAALVFSGDATLPLILAAALIEAVATTIFSTAENAALPNVVPVSRLPEAVARNEARMAGAALIGPPLGGVFYSIARGVPFLADAISYLLSMIGISLIRTPLQEERTEPAGKMGSDLREGIRFVLGEPFVRAVVLIAPLINIAFNGMMFAVIIILRKHGVAPGLIGTVDTIISVGGLLGALCAGRLQRMFKIRTLVLSICWLGAILMASGALLTSSIAVAIPIALAIFLSPACNAALFGYQAAITPDRLQGRVISVVFFAASSLSAFAPLMAGAFYVWFGGPGTVLAFAGMLTASAVLATASKGIRSMRDLSAPTVSTEASAGAEPAGAEQVETSSL